MRSLLSLSYLGHVTVFIVTLMACSSTSSALRRVQLDSNGGLRLLREVSRSSEVGELLLIESESFARNHRVALKPFYSRLRRAGWNITKVTLQSSADDGEESLAAAQKALFALSHSSSVRRGILLVGSVADKDLPRSHAPVLREVVEQLSTFTRDASVTKSFHLARIAAVEDNEVKTKDSSRCSVILGTCKTGQSFEVASPSVRATFYTSSMRLFEVRRFGSLQLTAATPRQPVPSQGNRSQDPTTEVHDRVVRDPNSLPAESVVSVVLNRDEQLGSNDDLKIIVHSPARIPTSNTTSENPYTTQINPSDLVVLGGSLNVPFSPPSISWNIAEHTRINLGSDKRIRTFD
jgi:hypothetical protein